MIEFTIAPIDTMADTMARVRADELSLLAAGVVGPMTMPQSRPKHVWSPPAGRRIGEAYVMVRPAPRGPDTDNAHMRRVRTRTGNGWPA